MKAKDLAAALKAGLDGLAERPHVEEEPRIAVRADRLPAKLGVRPKTIPDPSETTPKSAKLYLFDAKQARKALKKLR